MQLTPKEIEVAEAAQCDALCNPAFYKDESGHVYCNACGVPVMLIEDDKERCSACHVPKGQPHQKFCRYGAPDHPHPLPQENGSD